MRATNKVINWQVKRLGEVADYINGRAFKPSEWEKSGIPIIRIQNLNNEKAIYNYSNLEFEEKYRIGKGDLLYAWSASLGVYIWNGGNAWLNQHIFKVIPYNNCSKKYLFYTLEKITSELYAKTHGSGMVHVTKGKFEETEILLPPLPEQLAIVSKIEELFSELDNGKQQLLTAQQQLKVYRQSLLKAAFEGKLTAGWREAQKQKGTESLAMAAETEASYGNLPEGWKWVKSGDLFSFVTSGSRGWAKYYSNNGSIFIRITNMDFDSLNLDLKESNIQYVIPPSNSEGIRTKVQEGDFLFSITGYLGMFAIAAKLESAYVNQHVCLCRPIDGFNKKYVGYWIISKSGGYHYLNINQKGAVKAGLNLDDLKSFPVPLASLEEQQLIVDELESKLTVCDKIEETIAHSLQQAETLRQSILKRAFEGRLVNHNEL